MTRQGDLLPPVAPATAGAQCLSSATANEVLDSRFRECDGNEQAQSACSLFMLGQRYNGETWVKSRFWGSIRVGVDIVDRFCLLERHEMHPYGLGHLLR